jgi:hypothetical protein
MGKIPRLGHLIKSVRAPFPGRSAARSVSERSETHHRSRCGKRWVSAGLDPSYELSPLCLELRLFGNSINIHFACVAGLLPGWEAEIRATLIFFGFFHTPLKGGSDA